MRAIQTDKPQSKQLNSSNHIVSEKKPDAVSSRFLDSRHEAAVQRKLQAMANNSHLAMMSRSIQAKIDESPWMAAQRRQKEQSFGGSARTDDTFNMHTANATALERDMRGLAARTESA